MRCIQIAKIENVSWRIRNSIYSIKGLSPTVNTQQGGGTGVKIGYEEKGKYRYRKLTPKECWRLMGFEDEDFEKAKELNSDSQLYKQAGNSIVVDVLEHLLISLFLDEILEA